jgi:hypothetical protein
MNILKTICLVAIGMIAMSSGCEKSETISPDCDISYDCKDLQVLEEIKDEEVVVQPLQGGYSLFRNGGAISDENVLILCKRLPAEFQVSGKVLIVSGNRMNCCKLVTLPEFRSNFGCLFIASSIKEKRNQ